MFPPGFFVIVSGGTRGIGLAVAKQLSFCGATVAVLGRSATAATQAAAALHASASHPTDRTASHIGLQCDVRDSASVDAAIQAAVDHTGRLDALVNAAGVNQDAMLVRWSNKGRTRVHQNNASIVSIMTLSEPLHPACVCL